MKFDPGKTFPYPVLRPGSSDYTKVEFQIDLKPPEVDQSGSVDLSIEFLLSDPDLANLVKYKDAHFVLLVECESTCYRESFRCGSSTWQYRLPAGTVTGKTTVSPYLVCKREQLQFRARNWHSDYSDEAFDLKEGMVLALDTPVVFWVEQADEGSIGSIIELIRSRDVEDGAWHCMLDAERVQLQLSHGDYGRFAKLRRMVRRKEESTYVMNGVYLPVLVWLLEEADRNGDDFAHRRWYSALEVRLDISGCRPLGEGRKRFLDAQVLLNRPFSKFLEVGVG